MIPQWSVTTLLLTTVAALLCAFCCKLSIDVVGPKIRRKYKQYEMLKVLPGPPPKGIILGNAMDFLTTPIDAAAQVMEALHNTYGRVIRVWFFGLAFFFVARADLAEQFFNCKEAGTKAELYLFLKGLAGQGLLISNGELWAQRRKLITPTFHFSIMNDFREVFVENSIALVKKLLEQPKENVVDVMELMHLASLDNICETAMSIKIDALNNPDQEYIHALNEALYAVIVRIFRPWYWNDFIFYNMFPYGRKIRRAERLYCNFTDNVVKARREEMRQRKLDSDIREKDRTEEGVYEGGRRKRAFLDLLIETCETQAVPLSGRDLADEVQTFMAEGYETAGTTLSYTLYLLGLHPEIQEKVRRELEGIFSGLDTKPSTNDLQNMKYLEQVIKESLRLYTTAPLIGREIDADTQIGEFKLPQGTILVLDIFHLHRDPKYFPEPKKFDPERFTEENCSNRPPYAYVPFSAGSRNCIGQKFAMMELKVVLSYILRNFTLESVESEEELQTIFAITIRPSRKLLVKIRPRNHQELGR